MDLEPEYDSLIVRVVNSTVVSMDTDRLERYHGCPYVLGIDIFPMDYLSRNPEERALHLELVNILLGAVDNVTAPDAAKEEAEAYIAQVELPFETVTVPAPANYHDVLRLIIGELYDSDS